MPRPETDIHAANPADAEELSHIHAAAFAPLGQRPWTAESFRSLLAMHTTTALTIRDEAGIAAFILGQTAGGEAEIVTLATRPAAQKQGLARRLLESLLAYYTALGVRKVFLEVMGGNTAALALYRRIGFNKVGERPNYYQDMESGLWHDAIVLALDLDYRRTDGTEGENKQENLHSPSPGTSKPK